MIPIILGSEGWKGSPALDSSGDESSRVQVACSCCGSNDAQNLFIKDSFNLAKCRQCGFIFVTPRPPREILRDLYDREYFSSVEAASDGFGDYNAGRLLKLATCEMRLREIERKVKFGRILDVGCAMGPFLEVAARHGWDAHGVEASPYAAQWAREQVGLRVATGDVGAAGFADSFFDVVTMFDVLEHLFDPREDLETISRVLKKTGLLVVEVPNVDAIVSRVLGKSSPYFRPRVHLSYFSPRTMRLILEETGFSVVGVSKAWKVVSLDYLLRVLSSSSSQTWLSGALNLVATLLPTLARNRSICLPLGGMIVYAVKS